MQSSLTNKNTNMYIKKKHQHDGELHEWGQECWMGLVVLMNFVCIGE